MMYAASPGTALELWPLLEPLIARAAAYHPFLDSDGLKDLVARELVAIFVGTEADKLVGFAAVEVLDFHGRKVANIIFAAGEHGFLPVLAGDFRQGLESWCAQRGISAISLTGRPGWERIARRTGYEARRQVLVYRELT